MKTGLVYHPIYLEHDTGSHPENASRLKAIVQLLQQTGLWTKLTHIEPREATIEELELVHTRDYVSNVEQVAQRGGGWLDPDTFVSPASYKVALYAAGGALKAVDAVMERQVENAFALVRPPGHHAVRSRAMGFCLFNNVAIAAKYAQKRFKTEKVLIVDFDVHHGNGTQEAFYDDRSVLYLSTHQYPFYPGSGNTSEQGEGAGKGYNVNVPLPAGCGDEEYLKVFNEVLVPIADRFRPQLILASAGYDAHWADGLAMMQMTVGGYTRMAEILNKLAQQLCEGRLVCMLEGGYNTKALAASVKATLEVMLGVAPEPDPLGKPPLGRGEPHGFAARLKEMKRLNGLE